MSARYFLDTNVLVYAQISNDQRSFTAQELLRTGAITGIQQFNEFVAVTRRKLRYSWQEISEALEDIKVFCPDPVPITIKTHGAAVALAERYGYRIYDSLAIAAAIEASCNILYSEDLHDGQVIGSLTIRNPFRIA